MDIAVRPVLRAHVVEVVGRRQAAPRGQELGAAALVLATGTHVQLVGDRLVGDAGDWLLQYAPGDYGIAKNNRFVQVYKKVV